MFLINKGIVIERYNLTSNPKEFVDNNKINKLLSSEGIEILPVTILDDEVVKTKEYPTNAELCKMLEIPEEYIKTEVKTKAKGCGCEGGCC